MSAQNGVARAVDDFVDHAVDEFRSTDVIVALPAFKPQAIRGRLNWLVSTGRLVARRSKRGFAYHRHTLDERLERLYCSEELLNAMDRLSRGKPLSRPRHPAIDNCKDWVRGIVARARA